MNKIEKTKLANQNQNLASKLLDNFLDSYRDMLELLREDLHSRLLAGADQELVSKLINVPVLSPVPVPTLTPTTPDTATTPAPAETEFETEIKEDDAATPRVKRKYVRSKPQQGIIKFEDGGTTNSDTVVIGDPQFSAAFFKGRNPKSLTVTLSSARRVTSGNSAPTKRITTKCRSWGGAITSVLRTIEFSEFKPNLEGLLFPLRRSAKGIVIGGGTPLFHKLPEGANIKLIEPPSGKGKMSVIDSVDGVRVVYPQIFTFGEDSYAFTCTHASGRKVEILKGLIDAATVAGFDLRITAVIKEV